MVIAVSFAAASRRLGRAGIPVVAVILAVLVASDVLVTNEYLWKSVRNGGSHTWTDAVFPLSDDLMAMRPAAVYCADWDIFESLRLIDRGALRLRSGMDPSPAPDMSPADRQWLLGMIATPDAVWVTHVPDFEFFPAVRPKLDRFAAAAGFEHRLLRVIRDTHGRPTFELYRFQKQPWEPGMPGPHQRPAVGRSGTGPTHLAVKSTMATVFSHDIARLP